MSPDSALREITLPFADPTGQAASPLEAALASAARLGGFPPPLAATRPRHGRLVHDSQSCPFLPLHPQGPEFHPVAPQATGRMPGNSGKKPANWTPTIW